MVYTLVFIAGGIGALAFEKWGLPYVQKKFREFIS
jgi:hypothetical protein